MKTNPKLSARISRFLDWIYLDAIGLPLRMASRSRRPVVRVLWTLWLFPWIVITAPLAPLAVVAMLFYVLAEAYEGEI